MKRTALTVALALGIVAGVSGTASAASGPSACHQAVQTIAHTHRAAWRGAGAPQVECFGAETRNGRQAWFDGTAIHVGRAAPGARATYYTSVIAHELGHAWAHAQEVPLTEYARVRGFPVGMTSTWVAEDFAETFSAYLGEHTSSGNPGPYDFHAGAGVPTAAQIATLRAEHLLPR